MQDVEIFNDVCEPFLERIMSSKASQITCDATSNSSRGESIPANGLTNTSQTLPDVKNHSIAYHIEATDGEDEPSKPTEVKRKRYEPAHGLQMGEKVEGNIFVKEDGGGDGGRD